MNTIDKNEVVRLYKSGLSLYKVAAQLGCAVSRCHQILCEFDVPRRLPHVKMGVNANRGGGVRRYPLNESFFDALDMENKAYWAGFIAADGCVSGGVLIVGLVSTDAAHLDKLRVALGTTRPLKMRPRRNMPGTDVELRASSNRLVTALGQYGIVPHKSHIIKPWDGPKELMCHYWRGVVDGDGWINRRKTSTGWSMGVCGSRAMVDGFREYVCGLVATKAQVGSIASIYRFEIGGRQIVSTVVRDLYAGATVYLDRKYARALECIQDAAEKRAA